jgi:ankyrin repeat protein
MELVLNNKANTSMKTDMEKTVLHAAVRRKNGDAIKRLLEAGADINAVNEYGGSPLLIAASNIPARQVARSCHECVTQLLIDRGADVRVKNDTGWTVYTRLLVMEMWKS